MTTQEFSIQFDILYNNLASNAAPPLNEYEKSVFLTKAQSEIVLELYSGRNNLGLSFESSEEVRRYLRTLISYSSIDLNTIPEKSDYNVQKWYDQFHNCLVICFYRPADGTSELYEHFMPGLATIREELFYSQTYNNQTYHYSIPIVPCSQDDLEKTLNNPFRGPNSRRVIRVDAHSLELTDIPEDQLITSEGGVPPVNGQAVLLYITKDSSVGEATGWIYKEWYLKYPDPILLPNDKDTTLELYGKTFGTQSVECMLPRALHQAILDRAVLLAKQAYIGGQTQA